MTTEELLSEPIEAAQRRERSAFADIAGTNSKNIVLFGAGSLGRKVAKALRAAGVAPMAFADNNINLQGAQIDGITVMSPSVAAQRWKNVAVFVVSIFHPTVDDGMFSRLAYLKQLGCRYVTSFLTLAWQIPGILPHFGADLPSNILRNASELRKVSSLWQDKISAEIFQQQLSWRLKADFSSVSSPAPDQYFPSDLLTPMDEETFVDGGAYDGDTLRAMPWKFRRAWAVEPDPANRGKLAAVSDDRVTIFDTALGDTCGTLRFNAAGNMASARSEEGLIEVRVSRLDDILAGENPSYIKLDIEGDELAALRGAESILRRSEPIVAVCIYHRPEDIWTIPVYLNRVLPGHWLAVRTHARDGFELVVYAVPRGRLTTQI